MFMKLAELLTEDLILPSLVGKDVRSVLMEFSSAICGSGKYSNEQLLFQRLLERESQESTGIGNGIAIPHCKVDNLSQVILSIGYSDSGVNFKAIDGQPTNFFFVVISPSNSSVLHLRALAALSRLLKSQTFLAKLGQKPSKTELIELIKQEEEGAPVAP
jgi:mannitol/fructose-specific phosphotransferase system IIA component (Ntr-type)